MTTALETFSIEDRRAMLATLDGLRRQLDLVSHRIVDQPHDPLPGPAWDSLDCVFINLATVTKTWVN